MDTVREKGKFLVGTAALDCNRGDEALMWTCFEAIRRAWPGARLSVVADVHDDPEDPQTRQTRRLGVGILPVLLPNPRRAAVKGKREIRDTGWSLIRMQLRAILDFLEMLLLLAFPRRRGLARRLLGEDRFGTYEYLSDCEALVIKGGGWMYAYRGLRWAYYIWFGLAPLMMAARLGAKVLILPNSYGPFETRWSRWLTRRALGMIDLVTAREPESFRTIRRIAPGEVHLSADMAFGLEPAGREWARHELRSHGVPFGEKPCVGVTMRPWRFPNSPDPAAAYERYVRAFAELLEYLLEKGCTPVLFAHSIGPHAHEDDRVALRDLMEVSAVADRVIYVDGDYDCRQVKAMYGLMDYMVCTRFHSAIFSIAQSVPCTAVSYQGYKATGIMGQMHLRDLTVEIDETDGRRLRELFDRMVERREEIREKMAAYMADCRGRLDDLQRLVNRYIGPKSA